MIGFVVIGGVIIIVGFVGITGTIGTDVIPPFDPVVLPDITVVVVVVEDPGLTTVVVLVPALYILPSNK